MNFGQDLEIEILLRLPLKSLMRFKCVQTSWNNLIKSPYFVDRKTNCSISQNRSLLIIENSKLKLFPYEGGGDNEKPILVNSLFPNPVSEVESFGSCNGVFFFKVLYADKSHGELIIMWNPTTNEVHRIPRAPSHEEDFLYGFGAVDGDGDFKVVRLTRYQIDHWKFLCPYAEVYSLNTKSWTTIHTHCPRISLTFYHPRSVVGHRTLSSRYNARVNGVYYWIISSNIDPDLNQSAYILSFNFCNNEFRQLKGPIVFFRPATYYDDLIEIKGSLGYVLEFGSYKVEFEIWVMDQNGWSKKYAIEKSTLLSLRRFGNDAAEIFAGNAGELLKSYDHHGNKLRQFQIKIPEGCAIDVHNCCHTYDYFRIYEYVPSITLLSK